MPRDVGRPEESLDDSIGIETVRQEAIARRQKYQLAIGADAAHVKARSLGERAKSFQETQIFLFLEDAQGFGRKIGRDDDFAENFGDGRGASCIRPARRSG